MHNLHGPYKQVITAFIFSLVAPLAFAGGRAAGGPPPAQPEGIMAADAKVEKLGGGYVFTEGPASDKAGDIYFTDQGTQVAHAQRIYKWSAEEYEKLKAANGDVTKAISIWLEPTGRSNGMCFDNKGNLITGADEKCELWSIDKDKKVTVLAKEFEGKGFDGPNDIWVRPDNGIYFTDPFYSRPWWTPEHRQRANQSIRSVYYVSPGEDHKVTRVIGDYQMPNGIIGTPDGKTLYVADINARQTFKYDIQEDGTLKNKTPFCNMGSDGMTIDIEGNVYLTPGQNNSVYVFDKTGKQLGAIRAGNENPANVCFGGKDRDILFMTARTSVYGVKMKVKGAGSQ